MVSGIACWVGGAQSGSIKMASSIVLHDEVGIYFKLEYRRVIWTITGIEDYKGLCGLYCCKRGASLPGSQTFTVNVFFGFKICTI